MPIEIGIILLGNISKFIILWYNIAYIRKIYGGKHEEDSKY